MPIQIACDGPEPGQRFQINQVLIDGSFKL